jgi:hypothetical protein
MLRCICSCWASILEIFWNERVRCHETIRWCPQTALGSGKCEVKHSGGGGYLADDGSTLSKTFANGIGT